MSRPLCTDRTCERAVARYRDNAGYCLFHPETAPPVLDPKTGKPVTTTPLRRPEAPPDVEKPTSVPRAPRSPKPRPPRRTPAPARAAKPTPRDVDQAYDIAAQHVNTVARVARPSRPTVTIDDAQIARRYLAGEGLFPLAADLKIGAKRLRTLLTDQGVQLRGRGHVIGQRGPAPRPLDVDEAVRLYQSGLDSAQVARHLGVKGLRVQQALRDRGVLRRSMQVAVALDEERARALYAQGHNLSHVARDLGVRVSRVADLLRAHGEIRPKGRRLDGAA